MTASPPGDGRTPVAGVRASSPAASRPPDEPPPNAGKPQSLTASAAPPADAPHRATPPARRSLPRPLHALRLIHPFPTALNALAVVLLALVAADGWPGGGLLLRLAVTMVAAQAAIGAVNDLIDRDLDAATKPWKPIPAGVVSPRTARVVGGGAIAVAFLVGATLGPLPWLLSTAGLAAGLAYDLRLKRTAWSWLTYAVALPLVPLWVWAAVGRFTPALLGVVPVGLLLGAALQLANTLPDLHGDTVYGVRGLAHRLGLRWARRLAWGSDAAAIALAGTLGLLFGGERRLLLVGCGGAALLLAWAIGAHRLRPDERSLQLGWGLLAGGAALLAVAWLAALP